MEIKSEIPKYHKTNVKQNVTVKKCWNCKHRTQGFKIGKLTHYHCKSPTYKKQFKDNLHLNPWETLRVFSSSCNEHELRP